MIKTNLEPIEESDLDMEGKILRGTTDSSFEKAAPFADVEREIPQEMGAVEKDEAYGKILSKVQAPTDDGVLDQSAVADDAKTGSQKIDAESQVSHLIDIAGQKGVIHAVKVAQHMEDNFVLDTFHDRMLADELHDALLKKGMIKEL
jgi:hypothetical protein